MLFPNFLASMPLQRTSLVAVMILSLFGTSISTVQASTQIKGISLGEFSLGCDYYLIEDSYGDYSLVEWYGGTTTYSGDIIYGDLHSYGFKDLYDVTKDQTTHVWIDDWMLSEDSAAEKLIDKCGYDRNIANYFSGDTYSTPSAPPVASCPLHSHENPANPDKCLCDDGYAINSAKNACVPAVSCPTNSYASGASCVCNEGYLMLNNACVSYSQSCQATFGPNSYGDKQYCYCSNGYQMNATKTSCIKKAQVSTPSVSTQAPTKKTVKMSSSSSVKSKSSSSSSLATAVPCKTSGTIKTCQCPALYKVSKDGKQCVKR